MPTWDEIREHHRAHRDPEGASWWRVSGPTHHELAPECVTLIRVRSHDAGILSVEPHRGAAVVGVGQISAWAGWEPLADEDGEVVSWPVPPPRAPGARMSGDGSV